MVNFFKLTAALFSGSIKGHFGQWGEDVFLRKIFPKNKNNGTYLDIGAYDPFMHSNTAYLWMKGWTGFNVDANPHTIQRFNKIRPNDKNIWTAIIPNSDYENGMRNVDLMLPVNADYSSGIAASGTVNKNTGGERSFTRSVPVPASNVLSLIHDHNIGTVDYLNIDIEGYDEIILSELDLIKLSPIVITIEDYSSNFEALMSSNITKSMEKSDYSLAGRTGPTSIFVLNSTDLIW